MNAAFRFPTALIAGVVILQIENGVEAARWHVERLARFERGLMWSFLHSKGELLKERNSAGGED